VEKVVKKYHLIIEFVQDTFFSDTLVLANQSPFVLYHKTGGVRRKSIPKTLFRMLGNCFYKLH